MSVRPSVCMSVCMSGFWTDPIFQLWNQLGKQRSIAIREENGIEYDYLITS